MAKPNLVFLPGMMCDARLFAPQVAHFGDTYQTHVMDITGHDSVKAIAKDVLRDAPDRFALAGLSMGGIVAMQMVALAPERITHLALLDTNPKAELRQIAAAREPQIARAKAGALAAIMRDEMKPNYLADTKNRTAILDLCMQMALGHGADVFERQSRALQSRPDFQDVLRDVTQPSLVLCGRHDALCPIARHELMHDLINGSVLEIIEDAGHLPCLENPSATNAALARWLACAP